MILFSILINFCLATENIKENQQNFENFIEKYKEVKQKTTIYNIWLSGRGGTFSNELEAIETFEFLFNEGQRKKILKKLNLNFLEYYNTLKYPIEKTEFIPEEYYLQVKNYLEIFPEKFSISLILDNVTFESNKLKLINLQESSNFRFQFIFIDQIYEDFKLRIGYKNHENYKSLEIFDLIYKNAISGNPKLASKAIRYFLAFADEQMYKYKNYIYVDLHKFITLIKNPNSKKENFKESNIFYFNNILFEKPNFDRLSTCDTYFFNNLFETNWHDSMFKIFFSDENIYCYKNFLKIVHLQLDNYRFYLEFYIKLIFLSPLIKENDLKINSSFFDTIKNNDLFKLSEDHLFLYELMTQDSHSMHILINNFLSFKNDSLQISEACARSINSNYYSYFVKSKNDYQEILQNIKTNEKYLPEFSENTIVPFKNSIFCPSELRLIDAESIWYKKGNPKIDAIFKIIAICKQNNYLKDFEKILKILDNCKNVFGEEPCLSLEYSNFCSNYESAFYWFMIKENIKKILTHLPINRDNLKNFYEIYSFNFDNSLKYFIRGSEENHKYLPEAKEIDHLAIDLKESYVKDEYPIKVSNNFIKNLLSIIKDDVQLNNWKKYLENKI